MGLRRIGFKEFVAMLGAVSLVALLALGCASQPAPAPTQAPAQPAAAAPTKAPEAAPTKAPEAVPTKAAAPATAAPAAQAPAKKLKVAYLSGALVSVGSYEIIHYTGFKKMVEKYGFEQTTLENVAYAKTAEVVRSLVAQGHDMIVASSGGFATPFIELAPEFPKTWFVVASDLPSVEGRKNLAGLVPNFNEMGFLSGVTAALYSKSGKIGIVSGEPIRPVNRNFAGWIDGAAHVKPEAKVNVRYTQSWVDNAKSKEATLALVAEGADVVFPCIGSADEGVIQAAKEKKVGLVGYYTDYYDVAPDVTITSQVVDVPKMYDSLGDMLSKGKLEAKLYPIDIAGGFVNMAPSRGKLSAEIEAKVNQIKKDVAEGKIKVDPNKVYQPR